MARSPAPGCLLAASLVAFPCKALAQSAFINEIHYDNSGADTGEAVEVVAAAGTDLGAYELVFYNGASGDPYGSMVLSGTVPDQQGTGFGASAFPFPGIQNGAPDGIVLFHLPTASVVQFLSYEGAMIASGGIAAGLQSEDIGVAESGSTAAGSSLQLTGAGGTYADFTWTRGALSSFGTFNAGQVLEGGATKAALVLTLSRQRLVESASTPVQARLQLSPPPDAPETLALTVTGDAGVSAPPRVTVDATGVAVFSLHAVDNLADDGDRPVTVTVSDAAGGLKASAMLIVVDDDRMPVKGEAVRVASLNLLNGVGDRGSAGYSAVAASLARIEPDVLALQEVDSMDNFAGLAQLLEDIAFETDATHVATAADRFAHLPYDGGGFNSGEQSLAIASRFPIKRVVQIGRDADDGRREITRFPLYAEIDVPWAEDADDLHVVCVHYKAGTRDADRFRKAVEAYRTLEFLEQQGISAVTHNVIVLGDFNENSGNFQPDAFHTGRMTFADGSTFPDGFVLGDDLTGARAVTIPYDSFPENLFATASFAVSTARHADRRGLNTLIVAEGVRLDYIALSDRLHGNGNRFAEVFNSELDADFEGLPKQGRPVAAATSRAASDHFPVFGDYWLKPVNRITVSFSVASPVLEEGGGESVQAAAVLTPAPEPGTLVTVALSDTSGELVLPATVTVAGPANSAAFEVGAAADGHADRSRTVTLIAEADGYATGYGSVLVENVNASGIVLISQMLHSGDASRPRALELVNASAAPVSFAELPLELRVHANGAQNPRAAVTIREGGLAPGEVLVSGNAALGASRDWSDFVFHEAPMEFDGNDAIEIVLGGVRSDVFGRIGENPGVAWQAQGVATRAANLLLKDRIATGSSGWSDPSLRFTPAATADLSHLGSAPGLADPYFTWAEGFGLQRQGNGHPDADPDGDRLTNAGEFAFLTHPLMRDRVATTGTGTPPSRDPVFFRRPDDGRVVYELQSSGDLVLWPAEPFGIRESTVLADGRERIAVSPLLRILRRERYFRFRALLP